MKYGFIGCGNMGSSLVRALHKSTTDIAVADRSGKAKEFAAELGQLEIPQESVRMAMAFIGVLPLIISFPFFQKYFAKGLTLGGVKG